MFSVHAEWQRSCVGGAATEAQERRTQAETPTGGRQHYAAIWSWHHGVVGLPGDGARSGAVATEPRRDGARGAPLLCPVLVPATGRKDGAMGRCLSLQSPSGSQHSGAGGISPSPRSSRISTVGAGCWRMAVGTCQSGASVSGRSWGMICSASCHPQPSPVTHRLPASHPAIKDTPCLGSRYTNLRRTGLYRPTSWITTRHTPPSRGRPCDVTSTAARRKGPEYGHAWRRCDGMPMVHDATTRPCVGWARTAAYAI